MQMNSPLPILRRKQSFYSLSYLSPKEALYLYSATYLSEFDHHPMNCRIDVNASLFDVFMGQSTYEEIQTTLDTVTSTLVNSVRDFCRYRNINLYYYWVKECPKWKQIYQDKSGDIKFRDGEMIDGIAWKPNFHLSLHCPERYLDALNAFLRKFEKKHSQKRNSYLREYDEGKMASENLQPIVLSLKNTIERRIQSCTYLTKGVRNDIISSELPSWNYYPQNSGTPYPEHRFAKTCVDVNGTTLGKNGSQGKIYGNRVGFSRACHPSRRFDFLINRGMLPDWIEKFDPSNEAQCHDLGRWIANNYSQLQNSILAIGSTPNAKPFERLPEYVLDSERMSFKSLASNGVNGLIALDQAG